MIPVFDRTAALERALGETPLMREVLVLALEDLPDQGRALSRALERRETPVAVRAAHILKGTAGAAGAERLRREAAEVERAAREGDLTACRDRMTAVDREIAAWCGHPEVRSLTGGSD